MEGQPVQFGGCQPIGAKRRLIVAVARRSGKVFLWPTPSAGRGGTNAWYNTATQIVTNHAGKWIKVAASESGEGYDCWEVTAQIPVPPKPVKDIYGLLGDAFRGHIIDSIDHPILKTLLGEA